MPGLGLPSLTALKCVGIESSPFALFAKCAGHALRVTDTASLCTPDSYGADMETSTIVARLATAVRTGGDERQIAALRSKLAARRLGRAIDTNAQQLLPDDKAELVARLAGAAS